MSLRLLLVLLLLVGCSTVPDRAPQQPYLLLDAPLDSALLVPISDGRADDQRLASSLPDQLVLGDTNLSPDPVSYASQAFSAGVAKHEWSKQIYSWLAGRAVVLTQFSVVASRRPAATVAPPNQQHYPGPGVAAFAHGMDLLKAEARRTTQALVEAELTIGGKKFVARAAGPFQTDNQRQVFVLPAAEAMRILVQQVAEEATGLARSQ
jgi:hypothetical protein